MAAAEETTTTEMKREATADTCSDKFMGHKERRKSSSVKLFLGDYLNLTSEPAVQKILAKNGDSVISFSDIVVKVNKRNKMQERILLITDKAVYNIEPQSYKMKRRIPFELLGEVKLSKLPDNFFCLCVPSEYDYLMESSKKTEIVSKLASNYEEFVCKRKEPPKQEMNICFSNCFTYKIDKDVYREIQFSVVEGGISTQIFSKKKGK